MECMAIGGPNGNNPAFLNNLLKNAGVAQNNPTEQVSSTEGTSVDNTSKSAGRIAQLRAEALGDVFGTVGADAVARTKAPGASPIASSAIKFNEKITPTSTPEPSSVTAINGPVFGEIAAGGNSEIAFANQQLFRLAQLNQTDGLDKSDFQVAKANATTEKDNRLLALVGNAS